MRVVIDTNTAVSGLLWEGTPARLLDLANENEIDIFTSAARGDRVPRRQYQSVRTAYLTGFD